MRQVWIPTARRAIASTLIALLLNLWAASPSRGAALWRLPETSSNPATAPEITAKRHLSNSLTAYPVRFQTNNPSPSKATRAGAASRRAAVARMPRPVSFREVEGRGLLVKAWVNDSGAYTFAIDTGAGANIVSRRVAREARVALEGGERLAIGGLSGTSRATGERARIGRMALGEPDNILPVKGLTIVADTLPEGLDGILDPTESFSPLGYVLDMPNRVLSIFDPRLQPLRRIDTRDDETVVAWLTDGESGRPFVMLAGGRRALLDTGSGFGFALSVSVARTLGIMSEEGRERGETRDIAGGRVSAQRIRPATVHIGGLALRHVPTDLLLGANPNAPILLGRNALRPFQLTFDPVSRLIRIRVV